MIEFIKSFLRKIDYFGIEFNFQYQSKEKFHSATGGLIFFFFILISLIYTSITIVNLIQRKNKTIIYYKMQIPQTDTINFDNYTLTNAFGVTCAGKDSGRETELFSITTNKVSLTQYNGEVEREKNELTYSLCTNKHFYNKFNESVELFGLNKRYCFDDNNITIEGIYTDEVYKYVEITLSMRKTEPEDFQEYYDLLTQNDCSFQIYYTNFAFDVNNFHNPISPFIGNKFVKLSPNSFNKMEIYYLAQKFDSYENYLFDNYHTKYYAGFSDISSFSLYKGNDRFTAKPDSYKDLAKFFLRADTSRNIIVRKYMKLTEYVASTGSLLSGLLIILNAIFTKINHFYAYESIMKKLIQFKDVNSKSQNIINKIKREFSQKQIEQISKYAESISKLPSVKNINSFRGFNKHINLGSTMQVKVIKNFTIQNLNNIQQNSKSNKVNFSSILKNDSNNNENVSKCQYSNITDDHLLLNNKNAISPKKSLFLNDKDKKLKMSNQFNVNKLKQKMTNKKISNIQIFKFEFSLCELIIYFTCPCCMCKNLKKKLNLSNKGKRNLFFQLDILTFIKNTQTLEILTYILLEPYQRTMLKFLSKPSISLVNKLNIMEHLTDNIYIDINDEELNEFCTMFKYLQNSNSKNNIEKRLFQLVNLEMNNLLN